MNPFFRYVIFLVFLFPGYSPAVVIEFANGDSLDVSIKSQSKDTLVVEHGSLGELTVYKNKISNLQSLQLTAVESTKTEQKEEQEIVDQGLFGTGLLSGWDRSFDVGLNGAQGPSNNLSLRLGLNTHYEDTEDRWDFKAVYILKEDEEVTTDHLFKADLLKDWFIKDSDWFYFAHAGFDWDQFKDWDYRGRISAGSGYKFLKNEQWEVATRIGLSGIYEVQDPDDQVRLEGLVGLHMAWKISEKQSVKLDNIFYPAITDAGDYRNVTSFEWVHSLDYYKGMAIKVGLHNEYDTTQTEKNDLKYHAAIAWGL